MDRLKEALESLDEAIWDLESKVGIARTSRSQEIKNQIEMLKISRAREAKAMSLVQKIAARLDDTIDHVETILRH